MSENFFVVRCFSCSMFQVQQSKKSNKWICKVCGEKQSLKKVYGRGRAAVCRQHVQTLNLSQDETDVDTTDGLSTCNAVQNDIESRKDNHDCIVSRPELSKWSVYTHHHQGEAPDSAEIDTDVCYTTDRKVFDAGRKSGTKKRCSSEEQDFKHAKMLKKQNHPNSGKAVLDDYHQDNFTKNNSVSSEFQTGTVFNDNVTEGRLLVTSKDLKQLQPSLQGYQTKENNDISGEQPKNTSSKWGKYC